MFDCPNEKCGRKAERLVASGEGLGCDHCKPATARMLDGLHHRVRVKKWGVRVTEADAMRIKTNKKRSDGTYKPDPRWR